MKTNHLVFYVLCILSFTCTQCSKEENNKNILINADWLFGTYTGTVWHIDRTNLSSTELTQLLDYRKWNSSTITVKIFKLTDTTLRIEYDNNLFPSKVTYKYKRTGDITMIYNLYDNLYGNFPAVAVARQVYNKFIYEEVDWEGQGNNRKLKGSRINAINYNIPQVPFVPQKSISKTCYLSKYPNKYDCGKTEILMNKNNKYKTFSLQGGLNGTFTLKDITAFSAIYGIVSLDCLYGDQNGMERLYVFPRFIGTI